MTKEEIAREIQNRVIKLNSMLLAAYDAGMTPRITTDLTPYKDQQLEQVKIQT